MRAPLWLRDLAGAWIFYSVLPAWPGLKPRFERIARFAPWIGLVLGGLQSFLWLVLIRAGWPTSAVALLVIGLGAWLSGGLHLDGLMDTADGLAAGRERCLQAMDDSCVGASGVQALLVVVLLQIAALLRLGSLAPLALLIAAFWGRCAPLWAMARFFYLREEQAGTASFHRRYRKGWQEALPACLVLLLALTVVPSLMIVGWPSQMVLMAGIGVGVLPAFLVPELLGRRLGGHSGDSYGASVVLVETITLLLLAVLLPAG
ncbi:MAG: adenosylcobinamide-GDP ribazoletransferase [Cyanobacteriota bacterium]|nr:adenosylcobinamide-GDP ribazoletransferase [Cyanobacteriota bacterium]